MTDKEAVIQIPVSDILTVMLKRNHDNHAHNYFCMECGEDVGRCAAVDVIHTTEVCECRNGANYDHLVTRSHHKSCYHKAILLPPETAP